MKRSLELLVLLSVAALFVAGCGDDASDSVSGPTSVGSDLEGTITVSAAASLTDAFDGIGDDFTTANPGVDVELNFDSSSILATQIVQGAPADVFASADEEHMAELTDDDLVAGAPEVFARNELVIVTKRGNPEGISDLADLAHAGVVSLCGEEAPCGRYADQVLDDARVTIPESSVTRGQNVTATLTAVTEGDAVAGIVYGSDAVRAGDAVDAVTIPADQNVVAVYPIGVLAASGNRAVAETFVDYVLGAEGQAVLAEFGFLPAA